MSDRIFIYALCEPDTGEIRYVGQSESPTVRLASHLSDSAASLIRNWVEGLRLRGATPLLVVIAEVAADVADETEARYIEQLRRPRLLNTYRTAAWSRAQRAPAIRQRRERAPDLSNAFLRLRKELGLSQEDVAHRSGGRLTRNDVSKIEHGINKASTLRVRTGLCAAFGMTLADLDVRLAMAAERAS